MGTGAEPVPTFVGVLSRPGRKPSGRFGLEKRVMGLEPTTATLATWRSTTELHPRDLAFGAGLGRPLYQHFRRGKREGKGKVCAGPRRVSPAGRPDRAAHFSSMSSWVVEGVM